MGMRFGDELGGGWGGLRELRGSPPKFASKGARRSTFAAALEQGQQLWDAAAGVGPQTKPLLLFYGLTQAGRALLAGLVAESNGWRGIESHGLVFDRVEPALGKIVQLSQVGVSASGEGLVQQVARVLGSPMITDRITLMDVLGSITALVTDEISIPLAHRPLKVQEKSFGAYGDDSYPSFRLDIWPAGAALAAPPWGEGEPDGRFWNFELEVSDVTAWLAPYSIIEAVGPPSRARLTQIGLNRMAVTVDWDNPNWQHSQSDKISRIKFVRSAIDEPIDRSFAGPASGWLVPRLPGTTRATSQLIVWWLALYQMSMLARYQPLEWTALLNVDLSTLALPIERVLNEAYHIVPYLVRDILRANM